MAQRLQCRSLTGWVYYLAVGAIIAIEPALWPKHHCYVSLSLPRSAVSRVLVCEGTATITARYYDLVPVCDLPRRPW
jgi:hypothetical protein